jgi:hypothetical protein
MIRLELSSETSDVKITTSIDVEDWHPAAEIQPWIQAWAAAVTEALDHHEAQAAEEAGS